MSAHAGATAALLAVLALGAGCASCPVGSTEREAERQVLLAWLDCEECVDGELDALRGLGPRAVDTLAGALHRGPSPASQALLRHELGERHAAIAARAARDDAPLPVDRETYLAHQLSNRDALYRLRAVQGLHAIGGRAARDALRAAEGMDGLRPSVARAVAAALADLEPLGE